MIVNGGNSNLDVVMSFGPSHEAKLRELLHKLCSEEIKLCSDAAKEFAKLLKGETGADLLRLYFQKSPEFAELLEAWRIRHGKQGLHYIFTLIQTVLSHPEGRGRSTDIGTALDRFCLLLIEDKMDEVCKELNSKESKQQNAALGLLASMVRRGPRLASGVAGKFDFKGYAKLAEYKRRGGGGNATRRACVVFAVSFLEVGNPRLLSDVLQQKEMYSKVLRGLGKADDDDDDTVAYVLSTLSNKILVEESMVLPSLRSVLFGIATLEQLASISAREEDGGTVNELAHDVLVKVCTDPCNGLMPDGTRKLTGNLERLLMFMKKLRATEIVYHRDLLLAIVRGRPSLASAFFEEFPYNVENFASPSCRNQRSTSPSGGSEVQTIMKCICPRPFSRLLITRGMLCPKFFVKHGTLRFLSETLLLWDSLVTASHSCSEQIQASLERDVMGEVRSFFPDSQVLLTELKSQSDASGIQKPSLKRKAELNSGVVGREKRIKRSEKDVLDEVAGDIVIGGVGLAEDPVDADMTDGKEYLQNVSDIWASERCSKPVDSVEEAEMYLRIKIMDVLRIYVRTVPNVLEGSFDVFMKFLPNQRSSWLPAELQRAVLSFLNEYISWTARSRSESIPTRMPPHMYMQLDVFVNLFLFSSDDEVKDLAYNLALVAMSSTGAFDKNPSEIGAWFRFLQGSGNTKGPLKVQEAVQSTSAIVISFLYDAVRTCGKNMFKYWDIIRSSLSHLKGIGVSIGFSPLIVCVLQKCVKLLTVSKSLTFPEKSEISLYVCTTLKYLLQTQVDSRPLSCLVESLLSEVVDGSKDSLCEWWPLRALLFFSKSLSDEKPFILHSRRTTGRLADDSFADTLEEIKGLVRSSSADEIAGIVQSFSSALICARPESVLKNFDSVMAISWTLYETSFSILQAITFLEENFLGDLSKLSPDLLVRGSELTGSRNLREGAVFSETGFGDHSSIAEEIKSKMDVPDTESPAFPTFLEQLPFPELLTAIKSMDVSWLPRISELLLLNVSHPKSDSFESVKLILFHLHHIRSSYKVQPSPVLCQLSEICLRLMKHLFSQISEREPSSNKVLAPFAKWKHQVADTVFCHPVVMALLESPLDCGNVEIFSETSLATGRIVLSEIDQHILDLLGSTCEHFLFDERHIVQKGGLRENKSIVAFRNLVETLLLEFRGKLELCVGTQSYTPLLQPSQVIHALVRFISPFKLLNLARSMLIDVEELASPNLSKIVSLGLDIAGGAFEMLTLYSQQPAAKRRIYDLLWGLEEKNYDSNLLEEVYSLACRFSISFGLVSADNCLLKVGGGIFRGKHNQHSSAHLLTVIISQIVGRTPEDLIIHSINQTSMTRAKTLFYLVESSPLHRSVFGNFFYSMLSKQQGDSALTDDQFIMLLPAVLSYLSPVFAKPEKPCSRYLDITSVYSNILIKGFLQWSKFSSGCIFEEKYEEILLSTTEDIDTLFKASLLGKAVLMFQEHFAWTESPTKREDLLKVFHSMFPHTSAGKEMSGYEIKEVDVQSVDSMFNVAIREVAKVELSRICLFTGYSNFKRQPGTCAKEEMGSNKESLFTPLLNYLVGRWQCAVKRSDASFKGNSDRKQDKCGLLCKSLENFILRNILQFLEHMCEELVHLDSLPFLEGLMKSVLLYRFEDSKTLKILREIFSLLSRGKHSYAPYLQLLISHSQFTPTISSLSSSHTGELFRPISSILKHLIIPSPNSVGGVGSCRLQAPDYVKQLEIVKILRVLLSKCGKDSGIILKELHFLLSCSYGATLSEIDIELYKLIRDIELIDDQQTLDVSETGYLWGNAALKMREGLRLSQDASDDGEADLVEDLRLRLFKENLCVDPKKCALTVLYFPYQRSADVSDNSCLSDDPISEELSPIVEDIERYDPAFILRFSLHSLSMEYIEPLEFASLGLLAVAFVSMSSANLGIRKLAYDTLKMFLDVLESCTRNKQVKWIRLLLLCLKNGVVEPWQRIPTVSAVFAAEASLILLNSSHEHYAPIKKMLKSSPLNLRGIPLFHEFLWSSAFNFRSQRLWELRLVCVGLKSDEDAKLYIENSILQDMMSFFSTPLADDETKGLILQVVSKSAKFNKMARHLVQNCGLFSWCSSLISMFTTKPIRDEDLRLVAVMNVITDVLASRSVTEWLQEEEIRGPSGDGDQKSITESDHSNRTAFPLEGLMEISSRLCRLLGGGLVSVEENSTLVDFILQILSSTLEISQKLRKIYQPHFTISADGLLQLFEAVANCDSSQVEAIAERGLDTILMSTPPFELICMDVDKLRRFLLWGTSTALKSDLKGGSKPSGSHQDTKTLTEEPQEESMVAKFLRWLLGSVILGKLYSKDNESDPTVLSKTKPETLLTLLEYFKTRNLEGGETKSEHIIGEVIVHLQQLLSTNYSVLPSVVSALSSILLRNGLEIAGSESNGDYKLIKSLCSRISSPPEATPDWRWSYHQTWKVPSSEPATDLQKIDERHACQHLLLIFTDMLRVKPGESQKVLLHKSFDMSSVFDWERGLVEI
ncbi:Ribosome 60S biogenesis amino-terminal protein [Hirschfeldia incana]|nr:Ribosome 60S biogenesis amino-terminal protein [Hirschfeldia incana]